MLKQQAQDNPETRVRNSSPTGEWGIERMHSVIVRVLLFVALIGAASLPAGAVPAPPPPVSEWIEQLGHTDAQKQKEARLMLQRLGEPALAKLQKAAKDHPQPSVRQAAAQVAACIQRGEILSVGTGVSYWFNRVAFVDDGRHALVTGGALITMDLIEGKEVGRDLELQFARLGLAISSDGKQFATGHQGDLTIRVGDIKSGKVTQTLVGHQGGVHAVAFSPKADRLVSGSLDGTLRLWDLTTGKELRQFAGVTDQIRSVDYSVDGKQILSGHFGPKSEFLVRLWDAYAGKEIRKLKGHEKDVTAVFFHPDGKTAVSTGMDGAAIVWKLENGEVIRRMTHTGGIYGAALSPDGKRLLTAGYGDKAVRLWLLETGALVKSFPDHGAAALGVAFSKDGNLALSCDARATIRLWRLPK
jgi:WD40 repeat protein